MRKKNHYLGRILTFKVSRFQKENSLTTSSSFSTNCWVGMLTSLWGSMSKSYFRGKNELRVKAFPNIYIQIKRTLHFRLNHQSAYMKQPLWSQHVAHLCEHRLFDLCSSKRFIHPINELPQAAHSYLNAPMFTQKPHLHTKAGIYHIIRNVFLDNYMKCKT